MPAGPQTRDLWPLRWIASARRDYLDFPSELQDAFGFELYLVQAGLNPPSAKALTGLGGGILEMATRFDDDAFRTVYTVRLSGFIYVLHCFKKKSKQGIKTPKIEIELIRRRLAEAEADHAIYLEAQRR